MAPDRWSAVCTRDRHRQDKHTQTQTRKCRVAEMAQLPCSPGAPTAARRPRPGPRGTRPARDTAPDVPSPRGTQPMREATEASAQRSTYGRGQLSARPRKFRIQSKGARFLCSQKPAWLRSSPGWTFAIPSVLSPGDQDGEQWQQETGCRRSSPQGSSLWLPLRDGQELAGRHPGLDRGQAGP